MSVLKIAQQFVCKNLSALSLTSRVVAEQCRIQNSLAGVQYLQLIYNLTILYCQLTSVLKVKESIISLKPMSNYSRIVSAVYYIAGADISVECL